MTPGDEREAEEQGRNGQETRDAEIKRSAVDFIGTGRILVSVAGIRIHAIRGDLSVPCKDCGGPLPGSAEPIFTFTRDWISTSPDERFGPTSPIIHQAHRFGHYIPTPFWINNLRCPNCGKQSLVAVQLVVL